ncbi:BT_3987 domain-containing protein [Dysgonomonas sp.]
MKKYDFLFIKTILLCLLVICFIPGCKDDDSVINKDMPGYVFAEGAVAQIINKEVKEGESEKQGVAFKLRAKTDGDVEISFGYDELLVRYVNDKKKKDYVAFPQDLVSFSKQEVTVRAGEISSDSIELIIKYGKALEKNKEYLIPIKASVKKGAVLVPEKDSYLAIVVKPIVDNTVKTTGIKIFNCVEINNINPLNSLDFKLKESGKYLFDAVILFSPNMHYNHKTKKVQISLNEKNRFLFDNAEKYIKPLQDEGIKVLFAMTPHGKLDGLANPAGISNLTDEACRDFALELKKFNDKFGLDGVFLDDEYGYNYADGKGDPGVLLPQWSPNASSRLAYEIKKAMPDKWVVIYAYHYLVRMTKTEGKLPGEFVDYILPDYYITDDFSERYEGLPKERMGYFSMNFGNTWFRESFVPGFEDLRAKGYGANMVYDIDPTKSSFKGKPAWGQNDQSQLEILQDLAKTLFDEDLDYNDDVYKSDWSHLSGEGHKEWSEK